MAPSLLGVTRRMTDDAIVAHARRIGETMCCAWHIGKISDAEFADIVAYFYAVDRDPEEARRAAVRQGKGAVVAALSDDAAGGLATAGPGQPIRGPSKPRDHLPIRSECGGG